MSDYGIVALIEESLDSDPFCHACGAYATITSSEQRIYRECAGNGAERGAVASLLRSLVPHDRQLLVDLAA